MAAAAAAIIAAVPPPSGRRVPCEKCPLRAVECLREFTSKELEFVSNFKSGELNVEAGTSILLQSTNSAHLYTVLSGWAFRYKTLPDGRRQILNYALPSDLLGLQGSVNDEMQHSVEALTDTTLCVFPREKLWALYTDYPTLAFDVTWLAAREEQMLDEGLLSVGHRDRAAGLSAADAVPARRRGRAGQGQFDPVSVHAAARRRHARHVACAHQQDLAAARQDEDHALEGAAVRDSRPRGADQGCQFRAAVAAGATPVHLSGRILDRVRSHCTEAVFNHGT